MILEIVEGDENTFPYLHHTFQDPLCTAVSSWKLVLLNRMKGSGLGWTCTSNPPQVVTAYGEAGMQLTWFFIGGSVTWPAAAHAYFIYFSSTMAVLQLVQAYAFCIEGNGGQRAVLFSCLHIFLYSPLLCQRSSFL